jgi:hypothetical protein
VGTLQVNNTITARDTLSFSIVSADGSYIPAVGCPVLLTDSATGDIFGGTINNRKSSNIPGSPAVRSDCTCVGWEQFCSKRLTGERSYGYNVAGDIVSDLVHNVMLADGFGSVTITGPVLAPMSFQNCTVAQALDQICTLASGADTYVWDVTPQKLVRFYKQTTYPAPWSGDADVQVQVSATDSREKLCNRATVKLSKALTEAAPETFHGNGSSKEFTLSKPVAFAPTVVVYFGVQTVSDPQTVTTSWDGSEFWYSLGDGVAGAPSISVNGVGVSVGLSGSGSGWQWNPQTGEVCYRNYYGGGEYMTTFPATVEITCQTYTGEWELSNPVSQTVGVQGVDSGKQWYWSEGSNLITQDDSGTALSANDAIGVTFQGYETSFVTVDNPDSISERAGVEGGTGYYEQFASNDDPTTTTNGEAMAHAMVDNFGRISESLDVVTRRPGLRAGQAFTIALSELGVSGTYLIESVNMTDANNILQWSAKLTAGAVIGDWRTAFAGLASGGPGGSSVSGGASGGSGLGTVSLCADGALGIQADAAPAAYLSRESKATAIKAYLKSAPIGAALAFTIYTGADEWLSFTVPDGSTSVAASEGDMATAPKIAADTNIRLAITAVGSTFPGADLSVFIYL